MFIAREELSFPIAFNVDSAIDFAPPVLSKKTPIIEPQAITMPMFFRVFPNPSDRVIIIFSVSSPPYKPIVSEANISIRKGWILYLAVANTIIPIVIIR